MSQEPTSSNSDITANDLRDRLVDRALAERLGGEAPPDLTARILAAAEPSSLASSHGDTSMDSHSPSRRSSVRTWVLAASLLVNCGLVAMLLIAWDKERQTAMNQRQNNLPEVQGVFDSQDPIANREFETAARTEGADIDTSKVSDLEIAAATADDRVNLNAHGDRRQMTTDSYEITPNTGGVPDLQNRTSVGTPSPSDMNKPVFSGLAEPAPADRSKYESFYQVELNSTPQPNEPPIVYPSAEVWEELTKRREKYKQADAGAQEGVGQKPNMPSEWYLQDDVQYFAPGPEFRLAKEASGGQQSNSAAPRAGEGKDSLSSLATTDSEQLIDGEYPKFAQDQDLNIPHRSNSFSFGLAEQAVGSKDGSEDPQKVQRFAGAAGQNQAAEPGESVDAFDPVDLDSGLEDFRAKKPTVFFSYQRMYSELADARGRVTWGYDFGVGKSRRWPSGEPWQGSPDGQGIGPDASGDKYDLIVENDFIPAIGGEAVSTFSIDVDTASYANVRQMLRNSQVPPADAVRLEEFVNYFEYEYEGPTNSAPSPSPSPQGGGEQDAAPFAAHVETAACPWQPAHRLVRIGIKGREVAPEKRPLSNLVFLVDVSGSMNEAEKLPLVVHGLKKLTEQLVENDRVAIVVYASSEGLVLPSTPGTEKETILAALNSLAAGGSTAGGAGIQLAYQIAQDNFIEGGTNRVILCTDGDFNVGTTSTAELERMVEQKAKDTKVFLSCIGFGRGNLNDAMMENITGIGNGNYYYADGEQESERIFVKGMTGMLVTIAKDVKIQVEFNPAKVAGYRLLGYENRMLATQDFNDDKKDAGEIGAGHTVTCLYEIVPAGEEVDAAEIGEMKYQRPAGLTDKADTDELLTLKMRYKKPDGDSSTKLEWPVSDSGHKFGEASQDMQFAAAVASFGMLLRDSKYKGDTNYDAVIEIAESAKGKDPEGERAEFVELVRAAKKLKPIVIEEKEEATPAEKE